MGRIISLPLMFSLLFSFILFQDFGFCQDFYSLFKSDLPANHLNFLSAEAIGAQLESDYNKYPELVYWRTKYYHSIMKDKSEGGQSNSYMFTIDYIHSRLLDRKAWIERQMALSDSINRDNEYNNPIKKFLSEKIFMLREPDNFSYRSQEKGNNEVDFYLYKIYTGNDKLRYDAAENYGSYLAEFENDQLTELQKRYDLIASDHSYSDAAFIDDLLDKWYLLIKYEDRMPPVSVMMMEYFRNKFSLYNSSAFGISFGTGYQWSTVKVDTDFNQPDVNRTYKLTTIDYSKYIGLQLSYKYFLKDYLTYFSFIDISLIAQLGISPDVPEKQSNFVDKVDIISDDLFSYDQTIVEQFNLNSKNQLSLLLKLTVPTLFLDDNIFMNIGFLTGIRYSQSEFDIKYYYRKFERYFDNGTIRYRVVRETRSDILPYKNSSSEFIILPICDFNIILAAFTFQLSFTSADLSLKAGISF